MTVKLRSMSKPYTLNYNAIYVHVRRLLIESIFTLTANILKGLLYLMVVFAK